MVYALLDSWRYIGKDEKLEQLAWLHNRQSKISSTSINREHQIKRDWVVMSDTLLWKCTLLIHLFIHSFELLSGILLSELWKTTKISDIIADSGVEI
jgi:hypothetical protein